MKDRGRLGWIVVAVALLTVGAVAKDSWDHPVRGKTGVEHRTFQSASMRTSVGYNICFPPDYARDKQRSFPVIYYLHGFRGNESSFLEYANYWRANLPVTGPCILVFVNGGETSMFSDSADGAIMGETVVKELVAEVDRQFRTVNEAKARSLHGYSMGGFGALKLAFKYPELFGSVVAYGPTLASAQEMKKSAGKLYDRMFGSAARFAQNDPIELLEKNSAAIHGRVAVALFVGSKDEFLPGVRRMNERLEAAHVQHRYVELPGVKHDKGDIYERAAQPGFAWTGKVFTQPRTAEPKSHSK